MVDDPIGWLRGLGYSVETRADDDGVIWADLRSLQNPEFVLLQYGRGRTADDAITSAAERWRIEQIGTDAPRRPGDQLP